MQPVALNGSEVWAYVVETDEGLRVRFVAPVQRVPVRVAGKDDVWLFVTTVTELPPVVWVTMARRVRAAG